MTMDSLVGAGSGLQETVEMLMVPDPWRGKLFKHNGEHSRMFVGHHWVRHVEPLAVLTLAGLSGTRCANPVQNGYSWRIALVSLMCHSTVQSSKTHLV